MRRAALLALLLILLPGCLSPGPALLDAPLLPQGTGLGEVVPDAPSLVAGNPWRDREADAAINPLDPLHVAVFYNERPNPYLTGAILTDPLTPGILRQALAVSHDGGANWTVNRVPETGTAAPGSKWGLFCMMGDPIVFFDNEGAIHIVTLAVSCGGPGLLGVEGILHATTSDDGATWSEPDVAFVGAGGLAVVFHDREWAAYDPATGRIGIAWTAFYIPQNRKDLMVVFSEDNGRTWGLPEVVERGLPTEPAFNYAMHATWAADGKFHITGAACPAQVDATPLGGYTTCLAHFRGAPGGPWERSDVPLSSCGPLPEGAYVEYAVSVADFARERLFVAAQVAAPGALPYTTCVAASDDHGATWPRVATTGNGSAHGWIGLDPEGRLAVAYLHLLPMGAVPSMVLFDPLALAPGTPTALGPIYSADTDQDGVPEYGDYDGMATSGGRFVWALTVPNDRGEPSPEGWAELDVRAYRGTFPPV